jgi:hypothetical protein
MDDRGMALASIPARSIAGGERVSILRRPISDRGASEIPVAGRAPVRREGLGRLFAREVLGKHDGPWRIGFQHENGGASAFWRKVADEVFGPNRWSEGEEPVPGKPDVPPDHFIVSIADPPASS